MGERIKIDPRKQFSKRLARWTAVFWFAFLTWLSILTMLSPDVAMVAFYFACLATGVMIVMTIAYTHNSVMEKLAFAMLDKAQIEMKFGGGKVSVGKKDEPEQDTDGGESNG